MEDWFHRTHLTFNTKVTRKMQAFKGVFKHLRDLYFPVFSIYKGFANDLIKMGKLIYCLWANWFHLLHSWRLTKRVIRKFQLDLELVMYHSWMLKNPIYMTGSFILCSLVSYPRSQISCSVKCNVLFCPIVNKKIIPKYFLVLVLWLNSWIHIPALKNTRIQSDFQLSSAHLYLRTVAKWHYRFSTSFLLLRR